MTAETATETERPVGRPRRHLVQRRVLRRVVRRIAVTVVVLVAALVAAAGGGLAVLAGNLGRADGVFDDLTERPAKVSPDAVDVLVTSTDLTSVVHVDGDRKRVTMILLPPGDDLGSATDVGAVERLTGVRIDHYATFDWSLLAALEPTAGPFWPPYEPAADPRETIARQEDYLRMVIGGNVHQEMARNPVLLYRFLDTVSSHVTVDREWSVPDLTRLAFSLHRIRAWDIQYVTAPSGDTAAAFWDAVRHDQTGHLAELAGS